MDPDRVRALLEQAIPAPACELKHEGAWQLLIATILSAQSTDQRVNKVTPALFARYPTPAALAAASQEEVEDAVRSTGFFRQKAARVREASRVIVEEHGGEVPRDLDALLAIKGVARKTANLVLGTAYGLSTGIVVDTHVRRVSQRLGLTPQKDPNKIERDLQVVFPRETWVDMGHRLLLHGRYLCTAKSPECEVCPLAEGCPSAKAAPDRDLDARIALEAERIAEALA